MSKEKKFFGKLDNLLEKESNPKREEPVTDEAAVNALSERRKRALVTYLACLFGAAFVVVAISWAVSYRGHMLNVSQLEADASSISNEMREMKRENRAMSERISELEQELYEKEQALEYGEAATQEYIEGVKNEAELSVRRVTSAYEMLLWAKQAYDEKNEDVFVDVMLQLAPLVDYLDDEGQQLYETMYAYDWDAD